MNNTKITGHLQESQVMDQLLASLKSLGSIVALDEACMDYLAEMSVESMQMQFHIIYGLLVNLRMRQTEACAKANLHMNVQYQALNQLQEKHHHLKRELRQTYHYQASHYTKLKNKEIKALVERRDQLKVELAYCRLNRPPHTAPPNAATLDARAMEDIVYGASASSNGTMVVEIADEDKEYLRMAREHGGDGEHNASAQAVSAWTDHSGKPSLFEDSASYEQDDILRLNDLTIQKSHMMLKRLLNPN
ncbi:hypothetical protein SYNPS1DRAFT_23737 [Syncephalis pseudoplumigaleata]|uniref:Uncharacterized protein n=1 Tax=Syncephalis pseudoplumigaleata TaxID=1712513 RepID=A0A4P9YXW2_9FUNG|nr:hypothetical protein SYNPS1DRAFT_23737 [Syncephalis pseudoplumigaleata]|eukprot:RKP24171.1 hypothetical protein SYNPS1DRAFT_23737 [Syncephalis pseudoplumigaleata]